MNQTHCGYKVKPKEETVLEIVNNTTFKQQLQGKKDEADYICNEEKQISLFVGEPNSKVIANEYIKSGDGHDNSYN